jgi:hypothetical protein
MEVKKLPSHNSLRLPAAIQRAVLSWVPLVDLEPLFTLSKEFRAVLTEFVGLLAHFDIGDINVCTCHKSRDLPMAPGAGQGVCRGLALLRHCSNLQTLVLSDCIAGSADRLVALLPIVVARNSATLRQLRSCADLLVPAAAGAGQVPAPDALHGAAARRVCQALARRVRGAGDRAGAGLPFTNSAECGAVVRC